MADLHDDLVRLVDRIGMQAAASFSAAELRILEITARRIIRDLPPSADLAQQAAVLAKLQADVRKIVDGITPEWAESFVARAAREGAASMASQLVDMPGFVNTSTITTTAATAAAAVAIELVNKFEDVKRRILRFPRDAFGNLMLNGDVYQTVIAENATQALLGVSTTEQARKAAVQSFLRQGIPGFTDVNGRRWRIGTYAEMATRTAVTRAFREAGIQTAARAGVSLFSVLGGNNSCSNCGQWFGRVISASSTPGRQTFMHATQDREVVVDVATNMDGWRASGAGHPNCTCTFAAYLPGLSVATAAPAYRKEDAAARDRSRELERQVRAHKLDLALAEAAQDTARAEGARIRIREAQARIREHVKLTGQRRRYEREQLAFVDG